MNRRRVLKVLALVLLLVWTLLPLYWFSIKAFMIPSEVSAFPSHFYPHQPTLSGFANILGYSWVDPTGQLIPPSGQAEQVKAGLLNSLIVSVVVTIITMLVVVPLAYTFGRLEFPHKNKLLFAILLAVLLPPISALIPFYIMFVQLDIAGTLTGLVIVDLTITIPFVTWMLVGYFNNLPKVERLARIDGYSKFGTFLKVVVPMGKGGIGVGALIAFLFAWNEYTFAQVLVTGTPSVTLPAAISGFLFQHPEPEQLAASVLISLLPPLLLCYVLQGFITKLNIEDPLGGV